MATAEITLEEAQANLLAKRRLLGISETVTPIRSILSAPSNPAVKDMPQRPVLSRWDVTVSRVVKASSLLMPHPPGCLCPVCESAELVGLEDYLEKLRAQRKNPERLLTTWGVPKRHRGASFETFLGGEGIKKLCREAVEKARSLLLTGKTGCGKTHLSAAMMRYYVLSVDRVMSSARGEEREALFVTVPELLLEIRSTFGQPGGEESVVGKYAGVPLLVLDDLGSERPSEWVEATLYLIIDRRNREEMWTVVTTNLSLQEIETQLGARIASRLADMTVVDIKLPDYRKKRQS